jgi:hypothetical protein
MTSQPRTSLTGPGAWLELPPNSSLFHDLIHDLAKALLRYVGSEIGQRDNPQQLAVGIHYQKAMDAVPPKHRAYFFQ